jgi:hypothetical protein
MATAPTNPAERDLWAFLLVCVVMALALCLDSPGGRAFYDYNPWTEQAGMYFFASLAEAFGLSGVSVSLFEFFSIGLAVWYATQPSTKPLLIGNGLTNRALVICVSLMLAIGILVGFSSGNDFGLMLTQTRAIVSLPVWLVIGANALTSSRRVWILLGVIAGATLFKAIQGLWCYYSFYGGLRGNREYLIEHVTSEFLGTSILCVIGYLWKVRLRNYILVSACLAALVCYAAVFLINDRRSALVGLAFGLILLGSSLSRKVYRRYLVHGVSLVLGFCFFLVVTWDMKGAIGFPARTIKSLTDSSESSAGYRLVENANLLLAVAGQPVTGIGFGRRITMVYPLPDISGIYKEYDLVPHNTLLFVWTFAGPLGMAALCGFLAITIGLSLRLFRQGKDQSMVILGAIAAVIMVKAIAYIYADLGLREVRLLAEYGIVAGYVVAMSRSTLIARRVV